MEIGVLGATGPAGKGLAARLASVGHDVVAGLAGSESERGGDGRVARGAVGRHEWRRCSRAPTPTPRPHMIWSCWPRPGRRAVATASTHADELAGKVVVSMANGLERVGDEFRVVLPDGRSLAEAVQAAAPAARVVVGVPPRPRGGVRGARHAARQRCRSCAATIATRRRTCDSSSRRLPDLRGFDGGSLANAVGIEAFAAVALDDQRASQGRPRCSSRVSSPRAPDDRAHLRHGAAACRPPRRRVRS